MKNRKEISAAILGVVFVLLVFLCPVVMNLLIGSDVYDIITGNTSIFVEDLPFLLLFVPVFAISFIKTICYRNSSKDDSLVFIYTIKAGMAIYYIISIILLSSGTLSQITISSVFISAEFIWLFVFCGVVALIAMLPLTLSVIIRKIINRECSTLFGVLFCIAQFVPLLDSLIVLIYELKNQRYKRLPAILIVSLIIVACAEIVLIIAVTVIKNNEISTEVYLYEQLKIYPVVEDVSDYYIQPNISSDNFIEGNSIEFGMYQHNPLIWTVITVEEDRALLFLSDVICDENGDPEELLYHNEQIPITWAECSLRQWLNSEFYDNAFGEDREAIIEVVNTNENFEEHYEFNNLDTQQWEYTDYYTYGGPDTADYVFLISEQDIERYRYLEECLRGASARFFLRDLCENNLHVREVDYGGGIHNNNGGLRIPGGIRPAIWVDINYWES